MIKIYHNPRCSKSRQAVELLENSGKKFETVKYLDAKFTCESLGEVLQLLNITPIELVRKNEKIWKENFKDKNLSEKELIEVLHKEPKLIERPIIEAEFKAVIGRPKENIDKLII